MIHPLADVHSQNVGPGTCIWQFTVVLKDAIIGNNCNINCHCFVEGDVNIGNNVTIKSGVYIWNGITIEDDVFIGPSAVFTNDIFPRSKQFIRPVTTLIKKGASIGAGTIILAGTQIGEYAMTGIGSVITKNIPAHALVYGNPAKIMGWVDEQGRKLSHQQNDIWISEDNILYKQSNVGLNKL